MIELNYGVAKEGKSIVKLVPACYIMKTVIVALVASTAILAVSVSANAGGGAHNRCGSTWETCAARGKASPVAGQQPAQQYLQQKSKKGGSR